ncbi:Histidine kinase-like ATPase domain-containing protein [Aureimonas phyllosphaerae]|uniref:histidine kinase n=1 Tax=Aureimonas phyllosphaerae TaxID=1166078 RepID=A0A7W6C267_9HYPH|nr:sensor histidine kinase [Aureimonas phyllosphaerae]MBB3938141.1 two-component sensor histidine kinase [Aureimonas phyllosphaerae]MBB3962126.1 two-component sensor histidine kinase [Aureimonas phyllosphaerae]SFF56351.1 Histidine kinase-like ATPase domain-containing protein [Aureimonas phyllosphaerae]
MGDYLTGLCADLGANSELLDLLQVDVEPLLLKTERAIPIALIVNEHVTNAMKYAYPEGTSGPIVLSLKKVAGGMLELSVADEGVGFSGETTSQGLGTRLVKTMAAQIGGRVETLPAERGYRAAVVFPGDIGA